MSLRRLLPNGLSPQILASIKLRENSFAHNVHQLPASALEANGLMSAEEIDGFETLKDQDWTSIPCLKTSKRYSDSIDLHM